MRLSVKLLFLSVLVTSFAALAQDSANTAAQGAEAASSKATVYIYRYKQFVGSALAPTVYSDGNPLARMANGRYFTVKLDPGKHTFTSNDKQSGIDLDLKAGEQYFIRVEIASGFAKGHGRLTLVSAEQGSYELKSDKLKPLEEDKVADKNVVSVDPPRLQRTSLEDTKK